MTPTRQQTDFFFPVIFVMLLLVLLYMTICPSCTRQAVADKVTIAARFDAEIALAEQEAMYLEATIRLAGIDEAFQIISDPLKPEEAYFSHTMPEEEGS